MKKVILLTGYDHFFGQTRKPWVSIKTSFLISELKTNGIDVCEFPFHKIANGVITIKNSIVFFTFSQRDNLRHYIRDVIFSLQVNNNVIIPNYELLCCHENKGYQEILKKQLGLDDLSSYYFSSKRELKEYEIEYPVVLKTKEGSNGKGVFLVNSEQALLSKISELEPKISILTKLDLLRRRYLRSPKIFPGYDFFDSKKDYVRYKDYIIPETSFILQKFVSGLECDYRVIILGEHYYVTKRLTRKGDFRASGAKRFTFDFKASDAILDYSKHLYDTFDSPCLSLDIGVKDNQFYLFEFQALHFGINAIVRGKGFYQHFSDGWKFVEQKSVFEKELCNAFVYYLHKKEMF
jgi:hypothetical protein